MSLISYPFDAGRGGNVTEEDWGKMARFWRTDGIVVDGNLMDVTVGDFSVESGAGMYVVVNPGVAWLNGTYVENKSPLEVTIPEPTNSNVINVSIIIRVDYILNQSDVLATSGPDNGSAEKYQLQQDNARWEYRLTSFDVNQHDIFISDKDIQEGDERTFSHHSSPVPGLIVTRLTDLTVPAETTLDVTWDSYVYRHDPRMHTSGGNEFTIKEDGLYYVSIRAGFQNQSTGIPGVGVYCRIWHNNYVIVRATTLESSSTIMIADGSGFWPMRRGDKLKVDVTNNNTRSANLRALNRYGPIFEVIKMGHYQ